VPVLEPMKLADLAPPHERSAQPGDGKWVSVPEIPSADDAPLALRTIVHPHPIRKDVSVTVIAFDLARTDLVWVPGSQEPASDKLPADVQKGLVPKDDRALLLAAFNGGFLARHGRFGAMVAGHELLPPRDGTCTVAFTTNGHVRIDVWERLKSAAGELSTYRQTPPCLVQGGEIHERATVEPKKWGLSADGKDEIRRSALGIDSSGRVLFFGLGEWVVPKDMALGMKVAGAVNAAELDINWSYTRFNFYGHKSSGEPLEVVGTLVPQLVHTKRAYLTDIAARDFFYIRKKP
jgi:hypothetical protein